MAKEEEDDNEVGEGKSSGVRKVADKTSRLRVTTYGMLFLFFASGSHCSCNSL